MEFFDVVKKRHSVRAYSDKPVEKDKIQKILEAVNQAPSSGNLQAYEIFVIKDEGKKKALAQATFSQNFVAEAPIVLVFCANPERSKNRYGKRGGGLYNIQDATIAASYSQLAATALGLSSVWVGAFDDSEVLKVLGSPKDLLPVAIVPMGYSGEEPEPRSRKSLKDLVHEI